MTHKSKASTATRQARGAPIARRRRSQRTDRALQALARDLLADLEQHEAALRPGADTEQLHDFRIAGRRARTLLGQFKGVLVATRRTALARDLAVLSKASSAARDIDVYLNDFSDFYQRLPPASHAALAPLRAYLIKQQRVEYADLNALLRSSAYARLKRNWAALWDVPNKVHSRRRRGKEAIALVAGRRNSRLLARIHKQGGKLSRSSADTAFHDFRKRCKRLRYMLELFGPLYADKPVKRLVKELKRLQETFGALQDLHALRSFLQQHREDIAAMAADAPAFSLVIASLIAALDEEEPAIKASCLKRLRRFHRTTAGKRFKKLFC